MGWRGWISTLPGPRGTNDPRRINVSSDSQPFRASGSPVPQWGDFTLGDSVHQLAGCTLALTARTDEIKPTLQR